MYRELVDSVVAERGFLVGFSEVEEEAARRAAAVPLGAEGRKDLRGQALITIDGEDARDFDDAVGMRRLEDGGLELTVAIADVAAYVEAGGALDAAAAKRGNSVYLPDRVLPMLPAVLSDGACSLKPNEDRWCLCCVMQMDGEGNVVRYRFFRGIMRSARRMNYDEAAAIMHGDVACEMETPALLWELAQRLRRQRMARGAMMLEKPEKACTVDDEGRLRAGDQPRNIAHWAIEEAMIAANRCAADLLVQRRRPALHRIHAKPAADKVRLLADALLPMGIRFPLNPAAADFGLALDEAEKIDPALAEALTPLVLGTLSRAEYAPKEEVGHFGLACARYAHFTSPIRRYPDLLTHRAILAVLAGEESPLAAGELTAVGAHCGETETAADKAGWDSRQRLLCVAAEKLIGCEYEGYVSGMAGAGFFVTVGDLGIDGMVRFASLPGYWRVNVDKRTATAPDGSVVLTVATKVNVRLSAVVPEKGRVDFLPSKPLLA